MLRQLTNVSLTDSEIEIAKRIGKGNFTRGIVFAIEQSKNVKIPQVDLKRKYPKPVNLDINDRELAAKIGRGNMSSGIRFAINNYSEEVEHDDIASVDVNVAPTPPADAKVIAPAPVTQAASVPPPPPSKDQ